MMSMYKFELIRGLIDQGLNNSQIARRLKIDRATVRKYRQSNTPARYQPRAAPTKENPLKDFEATLAEWLSTRTDLSATSIYLFIKSKGYGGSLRTVERRVAQLKAEQPKERFFEQEYTPGEQSQFDFKEKVTIPFCDGNRVCHLFIATLPASSRFFAKAYPNKTYEAFADGFHSFFETIGGMTQKIRFDNLSPVVKRVLKGSERLYTKAFERALSYYDFEPLPCGPGKGNEKGDCERDIRTFARRINEMIFLSGRVFKDFDDLNIWLSEFSRDQLTEQQRLDFTNESQCLKPLPRRDDAILCNVHVTTVTKHGTAALSRSRFSVPDRLIGRSVKIVMSAFDVKIFQISPRIELVATHQRIAENKSSILLEHSITSLVRKPQAMVRWSHRHILFPDPSFERYYAYLKKLMPHGAEAEFLKSLNLIHHVSILDIKIGIELVMDAKSVAPFLDLKSLVFKGALDSQLCTGELIKCQPPLNTDLSHYDSLIPA